MRIACITTKSDARIPDITGVTGVFSLRPRSKMTIKPGSYYYATGLILKMPQGLMCHISESTEARQDNVYCTPFFVVPEYHQEIILRLVNAGDLDVTIEEGSRLFSLVVLQSPCRPNDEFYFADRLPS